MFVGRNYDFPVPEKYGADSYWKLNVQQRAAFLKDEKGYDDETTRDILRQTISTGMTKEQVLYSRGKPDHVNKTTTRWGDHEQWVYSAYIYLYFDNSKLTSWQSTQ
jgi:hypothetical protein